MNGKSFVYGFVIVWAMSALPLFGQAEPIVIHCSFDHGSMGPIHQIGENTFAGQTMHWIKGDGIGNQYYWFYFKIENVKDRTLSFELHNLVGVYRGNRHVVYTDYTQPVVSYDNRNWERITDVTYDADRYRFTFTHTFKEGQAWIAYAPPYPLARKEAFLDSLKDNPLVRIESIGRSREGRSIDMLTLPAQGDPQELKTLFFMGLQHPGEDSGAFLLEGLVDFMLSQTPKAKQLRKEYLIKLVLVMNPDGLYHGTSRYSWTMEDLNSEWDDDIWDTGNLPVEPETQAVKKWFRHWYQLGHTVSLMIDFHCHTQKNPRHALQSPHNHIKPLARAINKHWPLVDKPGKIARCSARNHFFFGHGIPSGTMELVQSHTGDGRYLTIDDYKSYGKGLMLGVDEYFRTATIPSDGFSFPPAAELLLQVGLPDPFRKQDGTRVASRRDWEVQRRYLKAMLTYYQYGDMPPKPDCRVRTIESRLIFDGTMQEDIMVMELKRKQQSVKVRFGLRRPAREGRFPVIIKNDRYVFSLSDMADQKKAAQYRERGRHTTERFVGREALQRGYVICKFIRDDVAADTKDSRNTGIFKLYPEGNFGTITAWAWFYQRLIDYLEEQAYVDAGKIVATGHSRGGKTALAAGVYDERIAVTAPNSSGGGGTASLRFFDPDRTRQVLAHHQERFPHWWCKRFYDFVGRVDRMPFDSHFHKALIAPRAVVNPHAREDFWANPYGTYLTYRAAQKVFDWLGVPQHNAVHWRPGGHNQNEEDWRALFDYCDKIFFGKEVSRRFDEPHDIRFEKDREKYQHWPSLHPWTAPSTDGKW